MSRRQHLDRLLLDAQREHARRVADRARRSLDLEALT